jgi:hypothetical protein
MIDSAIPHADFLDWLQRHDIVDTPPMSPALAAILLQDDGCLTPAARSLSTLLVALREQQDAVSGVERVADALRRYQKFARPGQPGPHVVQLRQQQGAARQAASVAKQQVVRAAASFVRDAAIAVPQRVALEWFVTRWIAANVPLV